MWGRENAEKRSRKARSKDVREGPFNGQADYRTDCADLRAMPLGSEATKSFLASCSAPTLRRPSGDSVIPGRVPPFG